MTAIGSVTLVREYSWHPTDGGVFQADLALGIHGFLTRQATRLVTLVGVEQSFARAQHLLSELSGWSVDDDVIRKVTHTQAERVQAARHALPVPEVFASQPVEVQIDAGKVNTLEGWRDVKVGVILSRKAGESATPQEWDQRDLPSPSAQRVVAAMENCEAFGDRVRVEADRLNVTTATDVTVLGDGAEWIWNLAEMHLPQADGVLDIYHAMEHIHDAVKAVWGETPEAIELRDSGRSALLNGGKVGLERWLASTFLRVAPGVSTDPLLSLAAYFAKHPTRLSYRDRLQKGRSIGSGAVEGGIKQIVNLRMKRTGARWRVDHVGPLVELRALSMTTDWETLWTFAA